ncbi:MAG: hypothetical protein GY857_16795 [Desulfobacula sp.]|nr:hypothetical protein [Desulfobacula sp.]
MHINHLKKTIVSLYTIHLVFFFLPTHVYCESIPIWKYDFRDVFYDITFIEKDKAVIVGARGRILVTHEKYKNLWSPRNSGTKEVLTCLSFADNVNGWAAGHGGIIIHTKDGGETWEIQRESSKDNLPLFDICFVSKQVGYACGAFDTFLKTQDGGKTWQTISTDMDNIYTGLAFTNEDNGYVVGEFGTILHTADGGKTFKQLDIGGSQGSFFGIALLSSEKILAFGNSGKIMISENKGGSFKKINSPSEFNLFRAASTEDKIAIVGKNGTLLTSHDGGKSFVNKGVEGVITSYSGICAHPDGGFVYVGEMGTIKRLMVK